MASAFLQDRYLSFSEDEERLYSLLIHFSIEEQYTILQELLGETRASKLHAAFTQKISGLHVGVEHPKDPHNAAAIVRSAEAMGLMHIHAVSDFPKVFHAKATTQGAYYWMLTHYYDTTEQLYHHNRKGDIQILCCDMHGEIPLEEVVLDKRTCLVFGSERDGLSDYALQHADKTIKIPMYGLSESMNLSVSAAICIHSLATRLRTGSGEAIYASVEEKTLLHARALLKSRRYAFLEQMLDNYTKNPIKSSAD